MKKILLVMAVFINGITFSQVPAALNTSPVSTTKMDFYLAQKHNGYLQKKAEANTLLHILVKGNINTIKQLIKKEGGKFKYSYGNIASIDIPVSALPGFNQNAAIIRMEGAPEHIHFLDDSSNVKNNITQVLNGDSPLTQSYQGKGVVIGFIDTGIDILHYDFRTVTHDSTRVKYYWDQNRYYDPQYTPSQYDYGQAWSEKQINLALPMTTAHDSAMDSAALSDPHGSNVAGVACGNGFCNGAELGGAPKADIIFVAYNFSVQGASMLTDAVNYIYTCADSLGEPCIINASLGSYDGSHDDSDLQGEMIDSMLTANRPGKPARMFVAAAGNEGTPYHVHDSLTGSSDTTFTWFKYDGGIGIVDIPVFANCNDFNNIKFKLMVDKVQTGSYTRRDTLTVFSGISQYLGVKTFTVTNAHGQPLGNGTVYGEVYAKGSYSLEFQIQPDSGSYYWGFEATGTGKFDIWDYGSINGVVDSAGLLMNQNSYPEIKKYKQPDTLMTICSSYQCSPHVITVQTYFNRLAFKNCDNTSTQNPNQADHPQGFVWTTSRGPTRNFIHMKPDVAAAGNYTLAAWPVWISACNTNTDADACHGIDGGTSLASPMVASAAALYLSEYPNATDTNVSRCITQTAYHDNFTGNGFFPNYNWGYGKLDAFAALTQCAATGIPILDAGAQNAANIYAYPNPYSVNTTIAYDFSGISNFNKATIMVYNMMGIAVKTIELDNNHGLVNLDRANLSSGIYFYSLTVDGMRLKTEKLVVL